MSANARVKQFASHVAPAADVRVLQPGASAGFDVPVLAGAPASVPLDGRLGR